MGTKFKKRKKSFWKIVARSSNTIASIFMPAQTRERPSPLMHEDRRRHESYMIHARSMQVLDEATRREFNESRSFVKDKARQPLQRGAFIRAFLSGFLLFCSTNHPPTPSIFSDTSQDFFLHDLLSLLRFFLFSFEASDTLKGKGNRWKYIRFRSNYYLWVIMKITLEFVFNTIMKILIIFERVSTLKTSFIFCKSIVTCYVTFFLYNKYASVVCKKKSISVISWIRNKLNLFNFIEPFSWIIQVLREIFKDNENDWIPITNG